MRLTDITPWNWFKKEGTDAPRQFQTEYMSNDPFRRMARLHQEVDRFFNEMMHEFGSPTAMEGGAQSSEEARFIQPRVDIKEFTERFEIIVEVPGVDEKDLHIDLSNDLLVIQGEKKLETTDEKGSYHSRECTFGSFKRVMSLPESVDRTKIGASFNNGILTVALPKQEQAQPKLKHIEIKH